MAARAVGFVDAGAFTYKLLAAGRSGSGGGFDRDVWIDCGGWLDWHAGRCGAWRLGVFVGTGVWVGADGGVGRVVTVAIAIGVPVGTAAPDGAVVADGSVLAAGFGVVTAVGVGVSIVTIATVGATEIAVSGIEVGEEVDVADVAGVGDVATTISTVIV